MAPQSSTLAWKIPWTEEPGGLQSMGSLGVGHDFTFTFTFHVHALEKEMAPHSSTLAWRIPGTGEPGGLPSLGSHRAGHDWSNLVAAAAIKVQYIRWYDAQIPLNWTFTNFKSLSPWLVNKWGYCLSLSSLLHPSFHEDTSLPLVTMQLFGHVPTDDTSFSVCLSVSVSGCLSLCLPLFLSVHAYTHTSTYLYIWHLNRSYHICLETTYLKVRADNIESREKEKSMWMPRN